MGRLIGTSTQYTFLPGHNFQNSYTYDAASNRTGLTAPDGSTNTYSYDTLNRLHTLTNSLTGLFGFGYDALSRRTQLTRPNGVNTNYNYDSVSRLLSVLHQAGSTTLDGASYGYDYAGNRTSKTNYLSGITSNYGYDAIYQLQQVTQGGSTTESYSYDAVGNRLSSSGVPTYSYNSSNELTSNSSGSYTYDNNGNTLTDASGKTYTWDFENRLVSAIVPGTGTVTFKYDPFGRRIQKSGPLGTTNYLYDSADSLEEIDQTGNAVVKYVQGARADEHLSQLRGSSPTYYEQDGLNSVSSLTSAAGGIANTYAYDSFGNLTASAGSLVNAFRYTGRDLDPETNIYYYRARYYEPAAGRFISEDPIGLMGGTHVYRYVKNNPTLAIDPSGLVTVVPLPDANYHVLNNIDASCVSPTNPTGVTAGGCEKVGFTPDWTCTKDDYDCPLSRWKAKVTITLFGDIYLASGPFPYLGRNPADRSVVSTATARAHENLHVADKLHAILPIYERFEAASFGSQEECNEAGIAATAQAVPAWTAAGNQSQNQRH